MTDSLRFSVEDVSPPKKDGASSVWRKAAGIQQLKALRVAAVHAAAGGGPFDCPVRLVLRLHVPAPDGDPTLWMRRQRGDLDNFVTGICDGLQAADPRAYDESAWSDVPAEAHPSEAIAFTDDSWVLKIEAELRESMDGTVRYEVEVEPFPVSPSRPGPVSKAATRTTPEADTLVDAPSTADRMRGCFFGGAVGDALGAAIEFDSIADIQRAHGEAGLRRYGDAFGRVGAVTDDTQMTLFTAEGILRAYVRAANKGGVSHTPSVVDHAYARWLETQGEQSPRWGDDESDGWLISVPELHFRRAPGNTCLSALRADRKGMIEEPLNASKGCGGVMRIAPVGVVGPAYGGDSFELGCEIAALTHGHPSGYLAAGALAELLRLLIEEQAIDEALDRVERRLTERAGHEETLEALRSARALAASSAEPGPEAVATLGEGWVADEALAIAVYCALVARSFEEGVLLAVNHSGDSDSTGAITGNILGTLLGYQSIPADLVDGLELREVIGEIADDWIACFGSQPSADPESPEWWERYPGW